MKLKKFLFDYFTNFFLLVIITNIFDYYVFDYKNQFGENLLLSFFTAFFMAGFFQLFNMMKKDSAKNKLVEKKIDENKYSK